jgi:hypothetical protein
MRIEGTKKAYVEVDVDQLDDIVANHIKYSYWEFLDSLEQDDMDAFRLVYKFFSGGDIDNLDRR